MILDSGNQRVRKVDAETGIITTVAGGNVGNGGLATHAVLNSPRGVDVDGSGNLYITDSDNGLIRRVDVATGIITNVAGVGMLGFTGDDVGPATEAGLGLPTDAQADGAGNVYILDNGRIRRVDAKGTITVVAGGGISPRENGAPSLDISLGFATDFFRDSSGNFYMTSGNWVGRVDANTRIFTFVAGTGEAGYSGDGGPALEAQLNGPRGIHVDGSGNLYIGDRVNCVIRRVDAATGIITTVAGTGVRGYSGDGGPATDAQLSRAQGITVDGSGNLYIADSNNRAVRKVDAVTGNITTIAGGKGFGFSGDGGPATDAQMGDPQKISMDAEGNIYIAAGNMIRKVNTATGNISTVAGGGEAGIGVEKGPATDARLHLQFAAGFDVDASGNIYISDIGHSLIRKVDARTGNISTVAGNGETGVSGDGGLATEASLENPRGIGVDGSGNLYIAGGNRVRKVDAKTGIITTISDQLGWPSGLSVNKAGDIFVVDEGQNRIHKIDGVTGSFTTIAGAGPPGNDNGEFSGDGGLAIDATFAFPFGIYSDDLGNVYFSTYRDHRVRRIDAETGIINTVVGNGEGTFAGDGGATTEASLRNPRGLAGDSAGNIYIADAGNARIRKVGPAPASGLKIEFARSISGRSLKYLWSGTTDRAGNVELEIVKERTPLDFRTNVSGYYSARAIDPGTGAVIARWHSIPISGGQETTLSLQMGGWARVLATNSIDKGLSLSNNPNPFNPSTQIAYEILEAGESTLVIYNTLGQQVLTLVQEYQAAGVYRVMWDGKDALGRSVSSGVYLYRLMSNNTQQTRRMLLLK
jgi:sugar lactone lactonase YvrE